uniref:Phenylacetic acid catabolic protein n=1 Tax=uncultured Paracoccus sp. TaxID=189685 RepID=UPI0025CBFD46
MSDAMNIDDYLAQGGVLTAPGNVPARYRGELMRLMSSFVDSELAASAGFAASINYAPGIRERIAASRITLEKADHAERVLAVMGDFGTDSRRYQQSHDWAARVARDSDLAAARRDGDMRLSVFHYPITGWTDAVVMNVLQGLATGVQMTELTRISYAPLAEVFRAIAPREARHAELGLEGLARIVETDAGRAQARD